MSGIFQGYANSNGRVRVSLVTKVPSGVANDRGMIVAGNRVIPYMADSGQPRNFHDGIAFDSATGLLLLGDGSQTPLNVVMGGLQVDARGAVVFADKVGDVIHQGVGLTGEGALAIEREPIATFIAHLGNNVASTAGPGTFSRNSEGLYQGADGNWRIAPENEPRFENDQLLLEPAVTNKCENFNADVDEALINVVGTNAAITRHAASDVIKQAGLAGVCGDYLIRMTCDNDGRVNVNGATGNTNVHTVSCWARVVSGAARLRIGGGAFPDFVDLGPTFQRYSATGAPAATFGNFEISSQADGTVIDFVLNQLEEAPVVSSPIITRGAAASRAIDELSYANADQFFEQAQGMALITMRPRFDKANLSGVEGLLSLRSGFKSGLIYYDNAFRSFDGTNAAAIATPGYVFGDEIKVALLYGPAGASALELGYSFKGATWAWGPVTAYDGSFVSTDELTVVQSCGFPVQVSNIQLYNENRGTAWVEANY